MLGGHAGFGEQCGSATLLTFAESAGDGDGGLSEVHAGLMDTIDSLLGSGLYGDGSLLAGIQATTQALIDRCVADPRNYHISCPAFEEAGGERGWVRSGYCGVQCDATSFKASAGDVADLPRDKTRTTTASGCGPTRTAWGLEALHVMYGCLSDARILSAARRHPGLMIQGGAELGGKCYSSKYLSDGALAAVSQRCRVCISAKHRARRTYARRSTAQLRKMRRARDGAPPVLPAVRAFSGTVADARASGASVLRFRIGDDLRDFGVDKLATLLVKEAVTAGRSSAGTTHSYPIGDSGAAGVIAFNVLSDLGQTVITVSLLRPLLQGELEQAMSIITSNVIKCPFKTLLLPRVDLKPWGVDWIQFRGKLCSALAGCVTMMHVVDSPLKQEADAAAPLRRSARLAATGTAMMLESLPDTVVAVQSWQDCSDNPQVVGGHAFETCSMLTAQVSTPCEKLDPDSLKDVTALTNTLSTLFQDPVSDGEVSDDDEEADGDTDSECGLCDSSEVGSEPEHTDVQDADDRVPDEFSVDSMPEGVRVPSIDGSDLFRSQIHRNDMWPDWISAAPSLIPGQHRHTMVNNRGKLVYFDVVYPENKHLRGGFKEIVLAVDCYSRRVYIRFNRHRHDLASSLRSIILEGGFHRQGWKATMTSDTDKSLSSTLHSVSESLDCSYQYCVAHAPNLNLVETVVGPLRDMVRSAIHHVKAGMCGIKTERYEMFAWDAMCYAWNRAAAPGRLDGKCPFELDTGITPEHSLLPWGQPCWIHVPAEDRLRRGRNDKEDVNKAELAVYLCPQSHLDNTGYVNFLTVRGTIRHSRDWMVEHEQPLGFVHPVGLYTPGVTGDGKRVVPSLSGEEAATSANYPSTTDTSDAEDRRKAAANSFARIHHDALKQQRLFRGPATPTADGIRDRVNLIVQFNMSVWDVLYGEPKFQFYRTHRQTGLRTYFDYNRIDLRWDLNNEYLVVDHPGVSRGELGGEHVNIMEQCDGDNDIGDIMQWGLEYSDEFLYPLEHPDLDHDLPPHELSQFALEQLMTCDAGEVPSTQFAGDFEPGDSSDEDGVLHLLDELTGRGLDDLSILMAAQVGLKDLSWAKHLNKKNERYDEVIAAKIKEIDGLLSPQPGHDGKPSTPCLERIPRDHPDFPIAKRLATKCRMLLDIKRDGSYKCRVVVQGFLQDKVRVDGSDFLYSSSVARFSLVRAVLLQPDRGDKMFSSIDISQAFLQSDEFPPDKVRYVYVWDPVDQDWQYFRQYRSLYGECSAPVRWQETLAAYLTAPEGPVDSATGLSTGGCGFVRGSNDRSVFYHPARKMTIMVYVDDIGTVSLRHDAEWFYAKLAARFKV